MKDIMLCEESLRKIDMIFYNVFAKILKDDYLEETDNYFNEIFSLYELYIKGNINLFKNKIVEFEETKYDIDIRTLYVNKDDTIEHVEYIVMNTIIERLFDKIEIYNDKFKFYTLYHLFCNLGLIKYKRLELLNGSKHVVLLNFTRAVLQSNK